ncbi:MAG: hypothetical protein JNL50_12185 [Phycisphaerae bacterium]|nr:hypothetical protein [Phycisphaerae bacterium]
MRTRENVIEACGRVFCGLGAVAALYAVLVIGAVALVPGLFFIAISVWAFASPRPGATVLLGVATACLVLGVIWVSDFVAARNVATAIWWCVLLFGPSIVGAILLRLLPDEKRAPDGICPKCEYPLQGLRDKRCPECGEQYGGVR